MPESTQLYDRPIIPKWGMPNFHALRFDVTASCPTNVAPVVL